MGDGETKAGARAAGQRSLRWEPGEGLGEGWALHALEPAHEGTTRVIARHSGTRRTRAVGVCRAEPGSRAMASTGRLDLFLMNDGGEGTRLTPDDEVRLVARLASALESREESLPGFDDLLGQRERAEQLSPRDHLDPLKRRE